MSGANIGRCGRAGSTLVAHSTPRATEERQPRRLRAFTASREGAGARRGSAGARGRMLHVADEEHPTAESDPPHPPRPHGGAGVPAAARRPLRESRVPTSSPVRRLPSARPKPELSFSSDIRSSSGRRPKCGRITSLQISPPMSRRQLESSADGRRRVLECFQRSGTHPAREVACGRSAQHLLVGPGGSVGCQPFDHA